MYVNELLNYRHDNSNPTAEIAVDTKITERFVSRPRSKEAIESFGLWLSMCKEVKTAMPILNNYIQEMSNQMTGPVR